MAKVVTDTEHYEAIADIIRNLAEDTEQRKPSEMPDGIYKAYNVAYEKGKAEGGNTEQILDEFASTVQMNGARTDFSNAFKNSTIADETISEIFARWNSTIQRANYMFKDAKNLQEGLYTDALDFSQCLTLLEGFSGSGVTKLKKIDARKTASGFNGMASMFWNCKNLESIDEFYPSVNTVFSGAFNGCNNLTKVIFMSEIAVAGLDVSYCTKISKESLMSILNQLKDYTGTGTTMTAKLGSTNLAKLTDAEKAIATEKGWTLA